MRDELSRLSAQWEGRLWKAHEHEKQALERQRIELNGDAETPTSSRPPPPFLRLAASPPRRLAALAPALV